MKMRTLKSILVSCSLLLVWAEQYVAAAERNAEAFSQDQAMYGIFLAAVGSAVVGFIYVQFHEWNGLAQIQGLAVDPNYQRHEMPRYYEAHLDGVTYQKFFEEV